MSVLKSISRLRAWLEQAPSYLFYYCLSWVHSTSVLRFKAAGCPYSDVRKLLLRRSGIPVGENACVGFGILVLGMGRKPPAVVLGDRAAIGPYVCFVTSSYPDHSRLGAHPDVKRMITKFGPIEVQEDAWIGAGAIILPGLTVGRGAVVGAGAVVVRDVPPYTVVAGVPARPTRTLTEIRDED